MSQGDFWGDRYLSVIPERLTAEEAAVLLDLMNEDLERFKEALRTFITESDIVVCECGEAECLAGPHGAEHWARASWRMSHIEDGEDDFIHLCTPCKTSREQRPDASRLRFEQMEDDGEEVAEGA